MWQDYNWSEAQDYTQISPMRELGSLFSAETPLSIFLLRSSHSQSISHRAASIPARRLVDLVVEERWTYLNTCLVAMTHVLVPHPQQFEHLPSSNEACSSSASTSSLSPTIPIPQPKSKHQFSPNLKPKNHLNRVRYGITLKSMMMWLRNVKVDGTKSSICRKRAMSAMAGREVREYTNLSDPKDKKWGKGKDKIDDEDITFQRMVAKISNWLNISTITIPFFGFYAALGILASSTGWLMQARCKRLQENVEDTFMAEAFEYTALDSDDLLYLKEQMEAEEDAERLLRRTEKRAFAAFKISFHEISSSLSACIVCTQQDLLKKVIEIKPKRHKVSSRSDGNQSHPNLIVSASTNLESENDQVKDKVHVSSSHRIKGESEGKTTAKSLLGLAYASSDNEED
ncbi:hypothetical protein Prudu_5S000100 [Prunus dulcis]|uniref:Transmembrane protein n=1 Tax=Prunus dulcis TaxID=3755 RepID=A0A5H2XF81_PRUDU|nr:hypothetical protein Prudu_5S000100 [Prunus dulcis]